MNVHIGCWNLFFFSSPFGSQDAGDRPLSSRQEAGKAFRTDQHSRKDLNMPKIPSSPIKWLIQITQRNPQKLHTHAQSFQSLVPHYKIVSRQSRITRYLRKPSNRKDRDKTEKSHSDKTV